MKNENSVSMKTNINESVVLIFNYVIKLKLENIVSLAVLRYNAYEFLATLELENKRKRHKFVSSIKNFEFINPEVYSGDVNEDFMMNLSNFRDELLIAIDKEYNPREDNILKRQVSPPLSAYDWQGHSMLNIRTSDKDYGLLFE